jgi:hypothetical protein
MACIMQAETNLLERRVNTKLECAGEVMPVTATAQGLALPVVT